MSPYIYSFNDCSKLWQHCKIDVWPVLEVVTTAPPSQSWGAQLHITGNQSHMISTYNPPCQLPTVCPAFVFPPIPPSHPCTACAAHPSLPHLVCSLHWLSQGFSWLAQSLHWPSPDFQTQIWLSQGFCWLSIPLPLWHPCPFYLGFPAFHSHLNDLCMLCLQTQISAKEDLEFFSILKGGRYISRFWKLKLYPNVVWCIVPPIMIQSPYILYNIGFYEHCSRVHAAFLALNHMEIALIPLNQMLILLLVWTSVFQWFTCPINSSSWLFSKMENKILANLCCSSFLLSITPRLRES